MPHTATQPSRNSNSVRIYVHLVHIPHEMFTVPFPHSKVHSQCEFCLEPLSRYLTPNLFSPCQVQLCQPPAPRHRSCQVRCQALRDDNRVEVSENHAPKHTFLLSYFMLRVRPQIFTIYPKITIDACKI